MAAQFQSGISDLYRDSGSDALCRELTKRVGELKSEILTAWFAEHGFAPGKAVLVEERGEGSFRTYIREITAEEEERARASANRPIMPCEYCDPSKVHFPSIMKFCPYCGRDLRTAQ